MSSGEVASQSREMLLVPTLKVVKPVGASKLISNIFSESEVLEQPAELVATT